MFWKTTLSQCSLGLLINFNSTTVVSSSLCKHSDVEKARNSLSLFLFLFLFVNYEWEIIYKCSTLVYVCFLTFNNNKKKEKEKQLSYSLFSRPPSLQIFERKRETERENVQIKSDSKVISFKKEEEEEKKEVTFIRNFSFNSSHC